jgi:hypothetical protein
MKQTASVTVVLLCLILGACAETDPSGATLNTKTHDATTEAPKPPYPSLPGDKWALYTVRAYRTLQPEYTWNPWYKRYELWFQYRMTLEDTAQQVRLTMTCGQMQTGFLACGQGSLLPNNKVWTREGVSGEDLWVYSNRAPEKGQSATFWHVDSIEAM